MLCSLEYALDQMPLTNFYEFTAYVTGKPCKHCVLRAIHRKIKRIVYGTMNEVSDWEEAKEKAKIARVTLEPYAGSLNFIRDRLNF